VSEAKQLVEEGRRQRSVGLPEERGVLAPQKVATTRRHERKECGLARGVPKRDQAGWRVIDL
jgi:hypothetical protein